VTISARSLPVVDPEDGVLVAVKRHRLAVQLDVPARGFKVAEGRLGIREVQVHQPARGVINEDQQGAGRPPVFKPAMVAAINLDEFADTMPPVPRLVHGRRAQPARNSGPDVHHEPAHRLLGQMDAMQFMQLLASQGWPEIGVPFPDDVQRRVGHTRC